jgi:hypothetical protein
MRATRRDERGTVLLLTALSVAAIMLIAGLVLDLGLARSDKKLNKSVADHAAAAGMQGLANPDGRPHSWSGVCEAYNYVKTNRHIAAFADETWTDGLGQDQGDDPCSSVALLGQACIPGQDGTYAVFKGTAGPLDVEIRSGYRIPDSAWGDPLGDTDGGNPLELGCDQLAVMVTERQVRGFGAVMGGGDLETRVRTVGRVILGDLFEANVALILLEPANCRALRTQGSGSGARVKVATSGNQPGLIQADSTGTGANCGDGTGGGFVVEGDAIGGIGPSILAESYVDPVTGAVTPSKIGIAAKALGFNNAHTPYPATVGDTDPVGSNQIGRRPLDEKYLSQVRTLATDAHAVVAGAAPVADPTWKVVTECTIDSATPVVLDTEGKSKVWFACDRLWIKNGGLTITQPNVEIVVAGTSGGRIQVNAPLRIHDPRRVWIRGDIQTGGQPQGVSLTSLMTVNDDGTGTCPTEPSPDGGTRPFTPDGKTTTFFVGAGHFDVGNGGALTMCSTTALLYGKHSANAADLPSEAGTPVGTPSVKSRFITASGGSIAFWTAPNELRDAQATPAYMATHPFEDLALWTESSEGSRVQAGSASTRISGVFALPNENFDVNGGGAPELPTDAQFWVRTLFVSGSGLVTIKPNAHDSVEVPFFLDFVLVR